MPIARFQMADGRVGRFEVPEGTTPENAQSLIEQHLSSETPKEEKIIDPGNDAGPITAAVNGFNSAVPFGRKIVSGGAALAVKGINALTGDDAGISLGDLYNQAEADAQTTAQANPKANIAGTIAGVGATIPLAMEKSIVGAIPITGTRGLVNAIPQTLQRVGDFARGGSSLTANAVRGGIAAAPAGALYGAGESETGNEFEGAKQGAGLAAGIGAALPVASAGIGLLYRGGKNAVEAIRPTLIEGIAEQPVTRSAIDKIADKVGKQFTQDPSLYGPTSKEAFYSQLLNSEVGAGEIGGTQLQRLARGSAQFPSGQKQAEEYLANRVGAAPDRIRNNLSKYLSPSVNILDDIDNIYQSGAKKAGPLYEKAFQRQGIIDDTIDGFLSEPESKSGLARGMTIQRLEARAKGEKFDPKELGVNFNEAGDPVLEKVPNMRLLDSVKRGLDAMIGDETDKVTGRVTEKGRALTMFRNSYVEKLRDLNPQYKAATDAAGDYLKTSQAARDGQKFTSMSPEQITKSFSKMAESEKTAFKAGMVSSIRDNIGRNDSANLYQKVVGNENLRKKLQSVMKPEEYANLLSDMSNEKVLYDFKNTLGNSLTTPKALDAAEFAPEELLSLITQPKITLLGKVADKVQKYATGLSDKTAGDVAHLLFNSDPKTKSNLVKQLSAMDVGKLSPQEASKLLNASKGGLSKIPVIEVTKDRR